MGKLSLVLYFAITLALLGSALGATGKVTRRRSPSLTSDQKALLLAAKSRQLQPNKPEKSTTTAIVEITKALARSHSASEVLTLNLTNLLILIVLKAVIFGIGLFYFGGVSFKGGYKGHDHGWGRSVDGQKSSNPLMTEGEILLMLTYLLGSSTDDYTCFHRVACENPASAKSYLKVSKLMIKGAKFAQNYVTYKPKYDNILRGLEGAISHGQHNGDCIAKFPCSEIPHL